MQRVAMELDAALRRRADVTYKALLLRSSWRWVHIRTPFFLTRLLVRLRRLVKQGDVDVILFSSMVTAWLAVPLRRFLVHHGVRTAAIVHGKDVTEPWGPYQRFVPRVFRALDLVLPVSGPTGDACIQRGLDPGKMAVVHNGVDTSRFEMTARQPGTRGGHPFRQQLPSDSLMLCSVGRHVRRKGFDWFIENVMPLLPEHVVYRLGGTGPETGVIRAAIERSGMEERVFLLGQVSDADLISLYESSDLFVMPNVQVPGDMEGFGVVMLEAGLAGLPTVASRLEGIREVIRDGVNGYFVESRDAAGFADRIQALDQDREALGLLSAKTRNYVESTFGWDAVAGKVVTILTGLAAGTQPSGMARRLARRYPDGAGAGTGPS